MKVTIVYPEGYLLENKLIELNDVELSVLLNSNKVGSEYRYFKIKDKIFEDTKNGVELTIRLEEE